MKVLVTGGRGMVGRTLIEATPDGVEIVAPGRSELNCSDRAATAAYIARCAPDVVVHSAGRVGGIQANIADPVGFLVENLDLGLSVVLAAQAAGVPKLLNLGSSCMYPRDGENPLREETVLAGALEPTNEGYALAKVATARLCDYISRADDRLSYKTLIPCNLYGRHDKFNAANSHLIPAIIRKVHDARIAGDNTIEIWGDGTARREFMWAGDLADGIWTALARFEDLPSMMNIGVGADHTINDYYHTAAEVIGWKGEFVHDLSRPTGMRQKLVSTALQDSFGWRPKTSLEEGIALTYAHFAGLHAAPNNAEPNQ